MESEQIMRFKIGDRVRVKVSSPSIGTDAWEPQEGDAGTVTSAYPQENAYGVLLDDDPVPASAAYNEDELEAEQ